MNDTGGASVGEEGHGDGHGHGSHATYKAYLTGFVLSVVLTVIPFWMVLGEPTDNVYLAVFVIFALGSVQIVVHMFYFLHLDIRTENGWQAMSALFTFVLLVIVLAGSIWVMFHLEENMMPAHDQIERVRNLP